MILFSKEDLSIFSVRIMVYLTRGAGFLEATRSSNYTFEEWKASVRTLLHCLVPLKSVWMWKWNQEFSKETGRPRSMAVKSMGLHAFSWEQDSSISMPALEALDFSLLRKMIFFFFRYIQHVTYASFDNFSAGFQILHITYRYRIWLILKW